MRKPLLTLSLTTPRQKVEAILKKTFELFIYGDIQYYVFSKHVPKIAIV
jgi:hypothetical protein